MGCGTDLHWPVGELKFFTSTGFEVYIHFLGIPISILPKFESDMQIFLKLCVPNQSVIQPENVSELGEIEGSLSPHCPQLTHMCPCIPKKTAHHILTLKEFTQNFAKWRERGRSLQLNVEFSAWHVIFWCQFNKLLVVSLLNGSLA